MTILIVIPVLTLLMFCLGLILIACCPGGSSSNVFSMLAKGDVALSVSLTACSSILTLFTIPLIMGVATMLLPGADGGSINMPVGKLIMQNLVLALLPVLIGMFIRHKWENTARRMSRALNKIALPLLVMLVVIFYYYCPLNIDIVIPTLCNTGVGMFYYI